MTNLFTSALYGDHAACRSPGLAGDHYAIRDL